MTKSVQLQKFGVALTAAVCFFAFAAFASAEEATIDTITEGEMPTISGTASGTDMVDLSITQDDTEVYAEMDIAVASGTWSHTLDEDLADGEYVAAVSSSSTVLATSSFTVDITEEEEENDDSDDTGETLQKRYERLLAYVAKLQNLIDRLKALRTEKASKAKGVGPTKNPNLEDGPAGLKDKCSDDFPGRGRGVKKGCDDYEDAQEDLADDQEDAQEEIDEAQAVIDALETAIEDADDGDDKGDAQDVLDDAKALLDLAGEAYDDGDYEDAEKQAKDAESDAKDAYFALTGEEYDSSDDDDDDE